MMMMTICFNEATRLLESSRSRLTLRPRQRHDCHDCGDDDYGGRHHHQVVATITKEVATITKEVDTITKEIAAITKEAATSGETLL